MIMAESFVAGTEERTGEIGGKLGRVTLCMEEETEKTTTEAGQVPWSEETLHTTRIIAIKHAFPT